MKIYRAILHYNNGDYNEWCEWYDIHSKWYVDEELAKQHLPMLEKLADALRHKYRDTSAFKAEDPCIESHKIAEEFSPIKFTEAQYWIKDVFDEFSYIPYEGPHSISSLSLNLYSFPDPNWNIRLYIGELPFDITFSTFRLRGEGWYYIEPDTRESDFYRYPPEERDALITICKDYAESILPYFKKYYKTKDIEDWEDTRVAENEAIFSFLKNSHIALSERSVEAIKEELGDWRAQEHPRYKKSLEELLRFAKWEPQKYSPEEYGDLAIKLREALNK